MRTPREDVLPQSDRLRMLALDVTKAESVAAAVEAAGPIDVLVNNAGVGRHRRLRGHADRHRARDLRDQHVRRDGDHPGRAAPVPRAPRRASWSTSPPASTLARMPLVAVYTASKTAVEGFTASLALELEEFDVRAKLVEPGYGPSTNFTSNGQTRMHGLIPEPYTAFAERVMADFQQPHASSRTRPTWPRRSGARRTTTRASCASPPVPTPSHSPNTAEAPARSRRRHTRREFHGPGERAPFDELETSATTRISAEPARDDVAARSRLRTAPCRALRQRSCSRSIRSGPASCLDSAFTPPWISPASPDTVGLAESSR